MNYVTLFREHLEVVHDAGNAGGDRYNNMRVAGAGRNTVAVSHRRLPLTARVEGWQGSVLVVSTNNRVVDLDQSLAMATVPVDLPTQMPTQYPAGANPACCLKLFHFNVIRYLYIYFALSAAV